MRLICISDTHTKHEQLPPIVPCDVLLHAGDATWRGEFEQLEAFAAWLASQPAKRKVAIAGNHDLSFAHSPARARAIYESRGIEYLCDEALTIDGVKFWGSPWQPEFCGWAFNLPRGHALRARWNLIPDDTQVLITHGPPHGIRDRNGAGMSVGCWDLLARVRALPRLRLHVFGHIHEGYSSEKSGEVTFVNASSCNGDYACVNQPIVVDLPELGT